MDDHPDTADTLAVLFAIAGFEPLACYSGADAVAALDGFRPDVGVFDLSMPGMDGMELARRVRAWRPVPLVAVTALGDDDTRRAAAAAGFDLHLTKPVDPDQLTAVVADLVLLARVRAVAKRITERVRLASRATDPDIRLPPPEGVPRQ